eukprot:11188586-Lingulodinium_polyedra.AAC.1
MLPFVFARGVRSRAVATRVMLIMGRPGVDRHPRSESAGVLFRPLCDRQCVRSARSGSDGRCKR